MVPGHADRQVRHHDGHVDAHWGPSARASSAAQKYAAASTRASKREVMSPSSTSSCPRVSWLRSSERRAEGSPDRVSWPGKTPRVISRSASRAAATDSIIGSRPSAPTLRVRRSGSGQLPEPGRESGQVGDDLARDGQFQATLFGVAGVDESAPRPGQLVRVPAQLLDLACELRGQPALRNARPAWSARSESSRCSRARSVWPGAIATVTLPKRCPSCTMGTSMLDSPGLSAASRGQRALGPPCGRGAAARRHVVH